MTATLHRQAPTEPAAPPGPRRSLVPATAMQYALWALTLVVVVGPIVPVLVASLWSTPLYERGGSFTLENFSRLLTDGDWWSAVGNSVGFAAMTTVASLVLGTTMAVLLTRTDLPGRRVLSGLVLLPVVLPGLVLILGWQVMWAPFGFASAWFRDLTGLAPPFELYSLLGMSVVGTTVIAPIVFLFVRGTLAGLDTSLEDAARTAGARPFRALLGVTVPLLRPALLNSGLIVFALAMEVLGLPLVLGSSADIDLISSYLYRNWVQTVPSEQGLVSAGAVFLLVVVTLLLLLRNRLTGQVARYATVTGKPKGAAVVSLGRARWAVAALFWLVLVVAVLVPLIGVVMAAFTTVLSPFVNPFTVLSTDNFATVFDSDLYSSSIWNSLLIATVGGLLGALAVAVLSIVAHRSSFRFRTSLQQSMLWPRALPGLVTGMGFFWSLAVLDPGGALRSTLWAIGIAFAVRHLALAYSAFYPALANIGEELDQAARTSGADWWTSMRHIVLPLVRPAAGVAFVLLFVAMLNDADPAVFLTTPETPVMGLTMLQLALTGTSGPVAALGVIQMLLTLVVLGAGRLLFGARPHA